MVECCYMATQKPVWFVDWGVQVLLATIAGTYLLAPVWQQTFMNGGRALSFSGGLILSLLVFFPIWLLQWFALRTGIASRSTRLGVMLTSYLWGIVPAGLLADAWVRSKKVEGWKRWALTGAAFVLGTSLFWFVYTLFAILAIIVLMPVR